MVRWDDGDGDEVPPLADALRAFAEDALAHARTLHIHAQLITDQLLADLRTRQSWHECESCWGPVVLRAGRPPAVAGCSCRWRCPRSWCAGPVMTAELVVPDTPPC